MKSNGGVISAREGAARPITTILSGPAAGALGASLLANAAGFDRVLTADAGGTSTDVCLVEHGGPGPTTHGAVGQFPVKVPTLEIAAWNQANAIQQVSVKRGLDPRDYTLVAFGGSGPLLAGRLVDLLQLRAALIPVSPGNVSAFGLLTVDLKNDYVQTFVQRHDRLDYAMVNAHLVRLEALARAALAAEGFAEHEMRVARSADLRYFGQAWEVAVELPPGEIDERTAAVAGERFHEAHEQRYGYSYRRGAWPGATGRQTMGWVNLRVTGIGPIVRPKLRERPPGDGPAG